METLGLILTAVSCTAGATWVIRSALAKLENALAVHVEEDATMHAKVLILEKKAKARR